MGGTHVAVGGIHVAVGGTHVTVGGTAVLVGGTVVLVGGTAVLVAVGCEVEVGLGAAGTSDASPGKVNAASSWALVNPSPSESRAAIAAKAVVLRPLER